MWAIDMQHVCYAYGDVQALRDLTLQVEEGACYALLGTNGAGKSTAIRLISGLLTPQGGTCTVLGQDMPQGAAAVRSYLAVSPQENAVAPRLTVRENLALIAGLYGAPRVSRNATVEAALATCGLAEVATRQAGTLSGGWQRRLSIALAWVTAPRLLLLDEPTLGLDVLARRELWALLRTLRGRTTVLLTTHYLEEAAELCQQIAVLAGGRLRACGTVDALRAAAGGAPDLEEAFVRLAGAQREGER